MNTLIKIIFVNLFILGSCLIANAQTIVTNRGTPWATKVYAEVKGSPYLTETWVKGDVAMKDGTVYKNVLLMYDQIADQLLFEGDNGDSLTFVKPVHEFNLPIINKGTTTGYNYRNGFPAIGSNTTNSFYEVINDDKVKILKRTKKTILSHKDYSSANQVSEVNSNTSYYILKNNTMSQIKPNSKTILEALSDKSAAVEKYIKENNLDVKRDTDLGKVFEYYNSL